MVKVELPEELRLAGLKLHVAPLGSPEHDSEIGSARFWPATVMANCAEAPDFTVAADGFAVRETVGGGGGVWLGAANSTIEVLKVSVADAYSA